MTATGERWVNVDGTLLDVHHDGTGVTYRPNTRKGWGGRRGGEGFVSVENMEIVRSSPFWTQDQPVIPARNDATRCEA